MSEDFELNGNEIYPLGIVAPQERTEIAGKQLSLSYLLFIKLF